MRVSKVENKDRRVKQIEGPRDEIGAKRVMT